MLNMHIHIHPTFKNEHWQLYDSMPGYKGVIRKLNLVLKKCVNSGMKRHETLSEMTKLMCENAKFGACDTEPRDFLNYLLDKIYG